LQVCVAVIARTDPNEQESVILLPELEALLALPHGAKRWQKSRVRRDINGGANAHRGGRALSAQFQH
jgi:hypothetical protein